MKQISKSLYNNLYILKILMKISPFRVVFQILTDLLDKVSEFALCVLLVRYLLNALTERYSFKQIAIYVIAVVLLRLVTYLIKNVYEDYIVPVSDIKIKEYLQSDLYEKAASVEIGCYEDSEFYDTYVKAMEQASTRIVETLNIISEFITVVTYIAMAATVIFSISRVAFIILLIPVTVGGVVGKKCNIINRMVYDENVSNCRKRDYVNRVYNLRGYAEEIRSTNMSRLLLVRYDEAINDIVGVIKKYGFRLCTFQYIFFLSNEVIADLLVLIYSTYRTLVTKTILLGDFYLLIDTLGDVAWSLREAVDIIFRIHKNSIFIENIIQFIEYVPKIKSPEDGGEIDDKNIVFDFKSVDFRYSDKDSLVLKNINLSIKQGEKILIVGENGSGKTTLIKLLMRLYDATSGNILLSGKNIKDYNLHSYRSLFSTVFQNFKLFALSIRENLTLSNDMKVSQDTLEKNLKYVGLHDKVAQTESGIDTNVTREFEESGVEFSLGQQQKMVLARMLTQNREVIILDEPSSSLDPIAEHEVFETVINTNQKKTVIFISHRLSSALLADRIVYMDKGEIKEVGNYSQLMDKKGKFYTMFNQQSMNYL